MIDGSRWFKNASPQFHILLFYWIATHVTPSPQIGDSSKVTLYPCISLWYVRKDHPHLSKEKKMIGESQGSKYVEQCQRFLILFFFFFFTDDTLIFQRPERTDLAIIEILNKYGQHQSKKSILIGRAFYLTQILVLVWRTSYPRFATSHPRCFQRNILDCH